MLAAHQPSCHVFQSQHELHAVEALPDPSTPHGCSKPCAAVVAKYRTSTSSSCWSFSRFGKIAFVIRSRDLAQPCPGVPAFSRATTVPCSGSCFKVWTSIPYDFATLNRMLGISSFTSLSIIGKMDCSITSRDRAGARV